MENKLIKLKNFEKLSKSDLQAEGKAIARLLLDEGFSDASVMTVQARKALEYLTAFVGEIDSELRDEVHNSGGEMNIFGATLSLSSSGDRLDYEADGVYLELKEALKSRAEWLKRASNTSDEVKVHGEIIPPVPLKTASKEVIRIKL